MTRAERRRRNRRQKNRLIAKLKMNVRWHGDMRTKESRRGIGILANTHRGGKLYGCKGCGYCVKPYDRAQTNRRLSGLEKDPL